MREKLKIGLILAITLCVLLMPLADCSALFYNERCPTFAGISGYNFVKYTGFTPPYGGGSNIQVSVLIPADHVNDFALDGAGNLVNTTTSTITSRAFTQNGNAYVVRWQSMGICQVRSESSPYTYTDLSHTRGIADTNIHFVETDLIASPTYQNDNFHVTDGENIICVLLLFILFFMVVNNFGPSRFRSLRRS